MNCGWPLSSWIVIRKHSPPYKNTEGKGEEENAKHRKESVGENDDIGM